MKQFESWNDTIVLLSGGKVESHPRPGEKFELSEGPYQKARRNKLGIAIQMLLLITGILGNQK